VKLRVIVLRALVATAFALCDDDVDAAVQAYVADAYGNI